MASSGLDRSKLSTTSKSNGDASTDAPLTKRSNQFSLRSLEKRFRCTVHPLPPLNYRHGTPNNVRVLPDRIHVFSGISSHPNYLTNKSTLNGNVASSSQLVTKAAQNSVESSPLFENLCLFEQAIHRCGPSWRVENLRCGSKILGKRAFSSPQQTLSHSCSASLKGSLTVHSSSTRVTSSCSQTSRPAVKRNVFMRPTSAKVPHYTTPERNSMWARSSTAVSHCYEIKGNSDGSIRKNEPLPLFSQSLHFHPDSLQTSLSSKEHEKNGNEILGGLPWQASNMEINPKVSESEKKAWWPEAGDGPEIMLTEAVRRLAGSGSPKKTGRLNEISGRVQGNIENPIGKWYIQDSPTKGTNKRKIESEGLHSLSWGELNCQSATEISKACLTNGDLCNGFAQTNMLSIPGYATEIFSQQSIECSIDVTSRNLQSVQQCDTNMTVVDLEPVSVTSVTTQISAIHLHVGHEASVPETKEDDSAVEGCGNSPTSQDLSSQLQDCFDDEEELPSSLENECSDDDDSDQSDCSLTDVSSSASSMVVPRNYSKESVQINTEEKIVKPALVPSLFSNMPSTIYFSTADEIVEVLPSEQRKLLKWKMSTVTPNVVKLTIARSHFKVTKKSHDWLGCWGHHMKSPGFKVIREYQKLNHFPGSFQIGRKDRLWRNLSKMQARFGKKEFNFFPQSFVLPQDIKLLKKSWEENGSKQKWIVKPPASARGIGIQVIHKWSQLPKRRPLLVQKYLHKPYLISGSKFDLRIYVYVTSYDPLRIYMFTDGLVRFASCKYSSSMKSLSNKFMHLTNYSVNKKNSEYKSNSDESACQGHKWALKALWNYLSQKGVNTDAIWEKIKDMVIKTIIASDPYVNSLLKMHVRHPYCCHELFGFDIMLDENLKPWVLEVNISPSLHSNSPLDIKIKGQMIRDLLNLAGFLLPQKEDLSLATHSGGSTSSLSGSVKEKYRHFSELSSDDKMKRAYYLSQRFADEEFLSSILDVLTPEDIRNLCETEDEYYRRGDFQRVFPSSCSARYLRFFEQPRYLNILLNQWEQKYYMDKDKGIELLKVFCQKGVHLGDRCDPSHVWSLKHNPNLKSDPHVNIFFQNGCH
ncbi:tubulin polyglutamylase TTLL4 isoform X2 [Polypterus senegalus]|uniref:tubulin polyglutamylase TTLL4 isoform X2 n=1 Tax=Polypterus senegalus TaxID=55291 RepID=UPI001963BAFA|nr:tubulin polyglutamylase TTLL4 isoform X2 [Polypterus senegalus]